MPIRQLAELAVAEVVLVRSAEAQMAAVAVEIVGSREVVEDSAAAVAADMLAHEVEVEALAAFLESRSALARLPGWVEAAPVNLAVAELEAAVQQELVAEAAVWRGLPARKECY